MAVPLPVYQGCFSASVPLFNEGYHKYQSSGWCAGVCTDIDAPVLGLSNGTMCWCGTLLPPAQTLVSDSLCDTPCQGYDLEDCGGRSGSTTYYTVWLTGSEQNVQNYKPNSGSDSTTQSATGVVAGSTLSTKRSSTSSPKSATSTTGGTSAAATTTPQATEAAASAQQSKSGLKHNDIVGIAVGVVLGVLVVTAVLLVNLWFWRRRRRRAREYNENRTPPPDQQEKEPSNTETSPTVAGPAYMSTSQMDQAIREPASFHLAPPAPAFLNPSLRRGSQATTGTSYDQPFYTPAEQRSFDFDPSTGDAQPAAFNHNAEPQFDHTDPAEDSMFTPAHALTTPSQTAEPAPTVQRIPRRPVGRSQAQQPDVANPNTNPFASTADNNLVDVGAGFMRANSQQSSPPTSRYYSRQELP